MGPASLFHRTMEGWWTLDVLSLAWDGIISVLYLIWLGPRCLRSSSTEPCLLPLIGGFWAWVLMLLSHPPPIPAAAESHPQLLIRML